MNEVKTGKSHIQNDQVSVQKHPQNVILIMMIKSTYLISLVPSVEARRATFPTKLPPPTPSIKPPLPVNLKEAKYR